MLRSKGWDEDVAMSAMREAQGNSTQALEALQEEDRCSHSAVTFQLHLESSNTAARWFLPTSRRSLSLRTKAFFYFFPFVFLWYIIATSTPLG